MEGCESYSAWESWRESRNVFPSSRLVGASVLEILFLTPPLLEFAYMVTLLTKSTLLLCMLIMSDMSGSQKNPLPDSSTAPTTVQLVTKTSSKTGSSPSSSSMALILTLTQKTQLSLESTISPTSTLLNTITLTSTLPSAIQKMDF